MENTRTSDNTGIYYQTHTATTPLFYEADIEECQPKLYERIEKLEKKAKWTLINLVIYNMISWIIILYLLFVL